MNQIHFHWGDSFVRSSEWRRVAIYVRTENQVMSSPCNATATSTHAVFLKFISNQIQLHTFQLALEIRVLLEMLPFVFLTFACKGDFPLTFGKEILLHLAEIKLKFAWKEMYYIVHSCCSWNP